MVKYLNSLKSCVENSFNLHENMLPVKGQKKKKRFRRSDLFLCLPPAPNDKMKEVLMKTVEEAKALVCKVSMSSNLKLFSSPRDRLFNFVFAFVLQKQVQANVCVTMEMIKEALDQLRGAVMIVYPMGLPPHDPIRMEFEDREDLSGTQVYS